MPLAQRLREYIAAAFTGIWIQSFEHEDALIEIGQLCRDHHWPLASWDVDRGLRICACEAAADTSQPDTTDPVAAIRALAALARPEQPESSALLVLPNFHRFIHGTEIIQALAHQVHAGKQNRTFLIVLSPVVQIPIELEKHFVVLEHELPDAAQLEAIARGVAVEPGELPEAAELAPVLEAAAGLTRLEAEGAFSLSLIRGGKISPDALWEIKTQTLKKSGLLTLYRGGESFADLGGLDALKNFCLRALGQRSHNNPQVKPRGVLLLGVPGTGKSAFAKALGQETHRPTLVMDVGSLMGSLVGQTEQNVRQALRIADAMSPCILFVDEIEKGLSGVTSGGVQDSGVSSRLFGTLLTWLSDHTSEVFFIATCNDISRLPPEFSRAERFDAVFFLDLPDSAQRQRIWDIYLRQYGLVNSVESPIPVDEGWTGAEIKSCCRLAALLDLALRDAARHVVPVSVTASEAVDQLRNWAAGRCLDANSQGSHGMTGLYGHPAASSAASRRRVHRPQNN